MCRHRPALSQAAHTELSSIKQDPVCKNNAPAFYQGTCCLVFHLCRYSRVLHSHHPWGTCHLPSCPSRPSLPGQKRTERGPREQFLLPLAPCPPTPTCDTIVSLKPLSSGNTQMEAHHCRKTLKKRSAFPKIALVWKPFRKPLCCGRKNTELSGPPPKFCCEPAR